MSRVMRRAAEVMKLGLRVCGPLALLLVIVGCAGGVNGPVIEGNRRSSGEDAGIFGVLEIDGDCLYLSQAGADWRHPVIWPHGTKWDPRESAVVLPGRTLVHEGDEISGGGGFHTEENLSGFTSQEGVDLALSCVDDEFGEVAVFNSGDRVEVHP